MFLQGYACKCRWCSGLTFFFLVSWYNSTTRCTNHFLQPLHGMVIHCRLPPAFQHDALIGKSNCCAQRRNTISPQTLNPAPLNQGSSVLTNTGHQAFPRCINFVLLFSLIFSCFYLYIVLQFILRPCIATTWHLQDGSAGSLMIITDHLFLRSYGSMIIMFS